jgi:hypothetical protein
MPESYSNIIVKAQELLFYLFFSVYPWLGHINTKKKKKKKKTQNKKTSIGDLTSTLCALRYIDNTGIFSMAYL